MNSLSYKILKKELDRAKRREEVTAYNRVEPETSYHHETTPVSELDYRFNEEALASVHFGLADMH